METNTLEEYLIFHIELDETCDEYRIDILLQAHSHRHLGIDALSQMVSVESNG